jgi:hypothetical protein
VQQSLAVRRGADHFLQKRPFLDGRHMCHVVLPIKAEMKSREVIEPLNVMDNSADAKLFVTISATLEG